MASTRRQPPQALNRFDTDGLPVTSSADTSLSSVSTEPHEPSQRRRVPSPPVAACPPTGQRSPELGSPVRKNNPYMWNVLGENASATFAARTSPIPDDLDAPHPVSTSPFERTSPSGFPDDVAPHVIDHQSSFDGPLDEEAAAFSPSRAPAQQQQQPQQQQQQPAMGGAPAVGSYLGQCYSSAFPPNFTGPKAAAQQPDAAAVPPQPAAVSSSGNLPAPRSARKDRKDRGGTSRRRPAPPVTTAASAHNTSASSVGTAAHNVSVDSVPGVPSTPQKPHVTSAPATADSPTSPNSPMTRVYRNGRPVPVPAAAGGR